MTAKILDGKALASELRAETAQEVAAFVQQRGCSPCLAAVLVGDDPASAVYVRSKQQACHRAGINSRLEQLPGNTTTDNLLQLIAKLNVDPQVHGILVQLPLPHAVDALKVLDSVLPIKDVDAFHPENAGLLIQGRPRFVPCTPAGIRELLVRNRVDTAGRHAVVVGRSEIVGKPMASLLLGRGAGGDATVTVCHSKTRSLADVTRTADILIAAIGRPNFITAEMVQSGAVVVDVGINRTSSGLVGDVDFASVSKVAGMITPVPGGVGPLTVAMVLRNTLTAAKLQVELGQGD